jgi:hypothetical protein
MKFGSQIRQQISCHSKFPLLSSNSADESTDTSESRGKIRELVEYREEYLNRFKGVLHQMIDSLAVEEVDQAIDLIADDFCLNRLPDPAAASSPAQHREWHSQQLHIQLYKSLGRLKSAFALCQTSLGGIYLRLQTRWMHCRPQIIDGVNLLLIGTGRKNNRMNHMGHPSIDIENEEEGETMEDHGDGLGWVKLTLPSRYSQLIALLSVPHINSGQQSWVTFDHFKQCAVKEKFTKDEVSRESLTA